ncbi:MAG: hypothetical protein ACI9XC_002009 [Gammaproteobacteria bacterium]|jgi:hypothetical protein
MKFRFTICLLTLLFSTELLAHRDEESLTTITRNPRTEMMEVVHRIHLHDAQYVLNNLPNLDKESRDLNSLKGKAHIALQVETAFKLKINNTPIDIYLVGAELEGEFIIVLQEFSVDDAGLLKISHDLFRKIFDNFTSRVIVWINNDRKTLFLNAANPEQSYDLTAL